MVQAAGNINKEDTSLKTEEFDLLFGVNNDAPGNRWQQPPEPAAGAAAAANRNGNGNGNAGGDLSDADVSSDEEDDGMGVFDGGNPEGLRGGRLMAEYYDDDDDGDY